MIKAIDAATNKKNCSCNTINQRNRLLNILNVNTTRCEFSRYGNRKISILVSITRYNLLRNLKLLKIALFELS